MKKILCCSLLFLAGQAFAQSQESYYSSTFQNTDYGSMDASGRSAEKANILQNASGQSDVRASSSGTVIGTREEGRGSNSIRTKMYYWTDARGIKHYSDSAKKAPKSAKTKVVVTARPSYSPPVYVESAPATVVPLPPAPTQAPAPLPEASVPASLPPTSSAPTSLPPIPPLP